jgi:hypothetical protein
LRAVLQRLDQNASSSQPSSFAGSSSGGFAGGGNGGSGGESSSNNLTGQEEGGVAKQVLQLLLSPLKHYRLDTLLEGDGGSSLSKQVCVCAVEKEEGGEKGTERRTGQGGGV